MPEEHNIRYKPVPTLATFHKDNEHLYRLVIGPVRSGKSVGMSLELMIRALRQRKWRGKRRSRFAIIRSTYRELRDTTLKTWLQWFPEDVFGRFHWSDMAHRINRGDVEAEFLFRALDKPKDVSKLLSLELTGAWVNEAREVPWPVIEMLADRVGQYPAKTGGGCTWRGVILDTNPPDDDHPLYKMAEEAKPPNWGIYRQPGAVIEGEDGDFTLNPDAENVCNLNEGGSYYLDRIPGKSIDYVRVYYAGQYGFVSEGRPVHPEYKDHIHAAADVFGPDPKLTIYVGIDWGLTPAAVLGQITIEGQWRIFDEVVTADHRKMGAKALAEILNMRLKGEYDGIPYLIYGDPAGNQESQADRKTPFLVFDMCGLHAEPAYRNNDPELRREALRQPLSRMIEGQPGVVISPRCKVLRKALKGGYCYKRVQIAGDERYRDTPDKNRYSHVAEACEYMMLGAGEGKSLVVNPHEWHPRDVVDWFGEEDAEPSPTSWMGA